MKKLLSLILASLTVASALASCAPARERLDSAITLASSDAQANAKWLDERLEDFPTEVILGIGSNESYGVDMSGFEADGYLLRSVGGETVIFGKNADGLDRAVRKYVKAAETGVAEDLDETYHEGYRVEKLTIAGNDISEYTIYYPVESTPSMLFGVSELQQLVKKACGVDLVAKEGAPEGKYISFSVLSDDEVNVGGFKYRVENGNVLIEGRRDFGCPNGVYFFLQNECGWDGLTYGDSILAESEHVDVKEGASFVGDPRFEYFYPSWTCDSTWLYDKGDATAEQASYGYYAGRRYNGYIGHACHGIQNNNFISEDYWSLSANKQPCYTDEYVYEELYMNVYDYVASRVTSGLVVGEQIRFVDIAHPDVGDFCLCKTCSKVFKEEKGTHAGAVVRCANRLEEDMDAEFDGLKYGIFAYWGTQKPCKTAPNEDVYVTFCTDRMCANHSLDSNECDYGAFYSGVTNQVFCEYIEGWVALNDNVYIWHYGLDNGFGSNNHVDTLYGDLSYLSEVGVTGVYMEFEYMGYNTGRITNQLGYLMQWDKDMTPEEYDAEYNRLLEKEYGDGWEYIRKCMDHWAEGENQNGCWHCWEYASQIPQQYAPYVVEHYDEVYEYAKKAISMANTEKQEIFCIKFFAMMVYQASAGSYFNAYDSNDEEWLARIEERWAEMIALLLKCGVVLDSVCGISTYGLATTCEEEAWTEWEQSYEVRNTGLTPRPKPEKYS